MKIPKLILPLVVMTLLTSSSLPAHDVFKEPLEKKYNLKTVSCKTCHPNNKDRSIHNKFGQLFEDEFKGMAMTKRYEAAKEKSEEAGKEYEKEMIKAFEKALKVVEKKQMSFEDLIQAGLLNGVRLNTKK